MGMKHVWVQVVLRVGVLTLWVLYNFKFLIPRFQSMVTGDIGYAGAFSRSSMVK